MEIHEGDCGEHQGGRRLYEEALRVEYFWPTMEKDAMNYVQRCQSCQLFGNKIHAPSVNLHPVNTPWPFHTWALDLIGPISPSSKGRIWILTATEGFTKWAEAIPLKKASSEAVAMFILEHIICQFGVPRRILTDNGTPFMGKEVRKLLEDYKVHHRTSTRYYPQGNGKIEAFRNIQNNGMNICHWHCGHIERLAEHRLIIHPFRWSTGRKRSYPLKFLFQQSGYLYRKMKRKSWHPEWLT